MSSPTSFWSRSYTVIRQKMRLNLYFGETKVAEFSRLLDEANAEIAKVGLSPSPDMMFLASNRAGMHFSCWFPVGDDAGLDVLRERLAAEKWKQAND